MKRRIAWILALLVLLSALSVSALAANGSFWMRDEKGELTGNGSSAVYKCTTESGGGAWERGLFINDVCALESGTSYRICFDITADQDTDFEVCYNKDTNWGEDEKAFGGEYELKATAEKTTVTHEVTAAVSGTLNLRIDLGKAPLNTTVTVSNVTVEKIQQAASVSVGTVGYPQAGGAGSFEMRDAKGELTGDGTYAAYKCTSESGGEAWERGLFINNLATLTAGEKYTVRFDVEADKQTDFEVCYNKDGNWGESEKAYGAQYELSAGTEKTTVAYELTPEAGGVLSIRIDLGKAEQNTTVTVSNVKIEAVGEVTYESIGNVSYPTVHSAVKTVKTEEKKITVTMQDGVETPPIFAASYDENGYMVSVYRAEIQDGRYEIATNEAVASYKWKIFFVDENCCPRYESYEIAK